MKKNMLLCLIMLATGCSSSKFDETCVAPSKVIVNDYTFYFPVNSESSKDSILRAFTSLESRKANYYIVANLKSKEDNKKILDFIILISEKSVETLVEQFEKENNIKMYLAKADGKKWHLGKLDYYRYDINLCTTVVFLERWGKSEMYIFYGLNDYAKDEMMLKGCYDCEYN